MYSLPDRRAWSPLHSSLGPRMAKSMPARCNNFASARDVFLLRSSKLPAQPTKERYSWSNAPPGSTISMPSSESAQSPRSPWFMPYALAEFSIARNVLPSSVGKSLSINVR